MTLETVALWWCYAFGALAAVGLYAVTFLFVVDKLVEAFKVKRAIIDWAWNRARGYKLVEARKIVTPKIEI